MKESVRIDLFVEDVEDKYSIAKVYMLNGTPFKTTSFVSEAGVASLNPTDKFNNKLGAQLAAGRALEKLGRTLQKQAWNDIKSKDKEREALRMKRKRKWSDKEIAAAKRQAKKAAK